MRKLFTSLLMLTVVTVASISTMPVVAAPLHEQGVLTFSDLGFEEDIILRGPYDSRATKFDLPATWVLQTGAELELEITAFSTGTGAQIENNFLGAILEVSFNDKLQQSIPLTFGEQSVYRVPIGLDSLSSPYEGGGHKLSFFLDAAVDCDLDFHDTTIIIGVNSKANFPYALASLPLDLQRLPWPIFLERGKIIDPVMVVLPASPSADELQAGFVVMGAFGRMTNGGLPLTIITADQLTDDILGKSHLLLVGKPSAFPVFWNLNFPIPLTGGSLSSSELNQDDGIIQILSSPWNTSRVILIVSGNSDQAVVKASQALSTSNIQTGNSLDYSIIAQVNPFPSTGETGTNPVSLTSEDIKFSDLGYSFIEVAGIGSHWTSYEFLIPTGQMPIGEVYLDLNISASTLVDSTRSEGVVYLNGVQIGSVSLSSDTSNLVTSRIYIPLSAIKSGDNVLDVVLTLLPKDECSLFTFSGMWVTIYPESTLHLPLTQTTTAGSSLNLRDLNAYPSPFTNDPSLGTTTFILSQQDPYSWLMAGKIAFDLGTRVTNPVLGFRVAFDGQIPDDLKTSNLILVGQPKNLGVLTELKGAMPAYYESGSNLAVLESQQVIYRISAEKSLGHLQLFTSPWNAQSAILGVFGTTPEGLELAINSILGAETRGAFAGNFVTIDGSNSLVVDTRTGLGIGRISPSLGLLVEQEDKPSPTPAPSVGFPTINAGRQLLFIAIMVVLALIAVILIVAILTRKRRS